MKSVLNDITSFNRFFTENRRRFVLFATTYLHDEAAAEDIFMEAMMGLLEKRHTLDESTNLPAYLLASIKHKSLNYLRHQQTVQETADQMDEYATWELSTRIATLEACEPEELFAAEIRKIIHDVLARQSSTTARIFMLSRYKNKSHKEIAALMDMSVKGVEFHIAKVTKVLRVALKDYLVFVPFLMDSGFNG